MDEFGGVKLAENEEEILLLELFPMVAKGYLMGVKKAAWEAKKASEPKAEKATEAPKAAAKKITGQTIVTPLPGRLLNYLVAPGDHVKMGQPVAIVEAMKMENTITATAEGYVNNLVASVVV